MLITEDYRKLNVELHERMPTYGTGGHQWAEYVRLLCGHLRAETVLDYGCGKSTLRNALADMDVREYDPAVPGKDVSPSLADVVVCTDVLEHVEAECVDAVLGHLYELARMAIVVDVSCEVGDKKLADGRPAHITVHPPAWWWERLSRPRWVLVPLPSKASEFAAVALCV